MTVQKELTKNIYVGNGQTTKFPFTFECPDNHPEYIRAYVNGKNNKLTETTNFSVDMTNKAITYPANGEPLAADEQLVIMRELPVRQLMNLVNNGPFFAEDIETAFDEGIMIAQQSSEKLGRALVAPPGSTTFDPQIPIVPGKTFRVSDDGTHLQATEDPGKVIDEAKAFKGEAEAARDITIANKDIAVEAAKEAKQVVDNLQITGESTAQAKKSAEAALTSEKNAKTSEEAVNTKAEDVTNKHDDVVTKHNDVVIKAEQAATSATNAQQAYTNADSVAIQLTEYLKTKESLTAPAVDKTMLIEGSAADSKVVGENIGELKKDLNYKIGKAAIGEKELEFTNSGYVRASDGYIVKTSSAQNTGFCRIDGVSRIIAHINLSQEGAKIAFYSRNKEYLKDISVISTNSTYAEIDLDITSDIYANAKYCIISNYGSKTKMAKVIGTVAPYSIKATADEAKATADEAITPIRTTFFDEVNIGAPENVENVHKLPYADGIVGSSNNVWSLIFKCKPNTDYYIYIPDRNRRNVAESETDKFVDGETYTILPMSIINYSGVEVVKITTGENAKRIMFYYFNGSYDYDTNKDKIIILENKWVDAPYVHIPLQYLPKELVKKSKHYGTFSIIGDSYSSFKGYMANANAATWYPASDHNMNDTNDVENVEQTWWYKFANKYNSRLLENNSWSGSTIAYDGYSEGLEDGKETSFIQRMSLLTTPQLILIYGGTNDSWVAGDTKRDDFLGEYKYSDFSESDFIYFRPALAYLLDKLKHKHIGAKIIFMLNASLNNIKESVHEICAHYEIGVCEITGIALAHSHPTDEGMTSIAEQLISFFKSNG